MPKQPSGRSLLATILAPLGCRVVESDPAKLVAGSWTIDALRVATGEGDCERLSSETGDRAGELYFEDEPPTDIPAAHTLKYVLRKRLDEATLEIEEIAAPATQVAGWGPLVGEEAVHVEAPLDDAFAGDYLVVEHSLLTLHLRHTGTLGDDAATCVRTDFFLVAGADDPDDS